MAQPIIIGEIIQKVLSEIKQIMVSLKQNNMKKTAIQECIERSSRLDFMHWFYANKERLIKEEKEQLVEAYYAGTAQFDNASPIVNANTHQMNMENDNANVLGEGFNTHQTILVGWKNGKIFYCRTFDDENDRENMFKGFDYVRGVADSYIMTSQLDNTIVQGD